MKILFILKKNEVYSFVSYTRRSSGLWNSTRFIVESLQARGVDAEIVEVNDNNDIDREVTKFKPDAVVIEALWVVPDKFDVLKRLHPKVQWYIHLHSHMPFLALEGIAMQWVREYAARGIGMIANSAPSFAALNVLVPDETLMPGPAPLTFLPNVYISKPRVTQFSNSDTINIGCFGAVRPLKNHLLQALAAIRFAREKKKCLNFHINGSRIETGGGPVLKNLIQLFEGQPDCQLVQSPWNEPDQFLAYLQTMDLGMQVSLTETFNVVCADYVTAGIPVVASKEVSWISSSSQAADDDIDDIVKTMYRVWQRTGLIKKNQRLLLKNSEVAQDLWFEFTQKCAQLAAIN
jgi:hypothetical protein